MQSNPSSTATRSLSAPAASVASAALLAVSMFTGCGTGMGTSLTSTSPVAPQKPSHLHGIVRGGQQPVGGATIQLYSAGASGNGSTATALLNIAAVSDANGDFNFTGQYQCPQQGALTYIVATGGNPGLAPGTNNAAIAMMAVTGPCNTANPDSNGDGGFYYTLDPNLTVNIDEVTTVAGVYALAPFMGTYYFQVGAAALPGITTAFTNATMLADISTGVSPGPGLPPTVTYNAGTGLPVMVNTVADILSACVNSTGTDGTCTQLFSNFAALGVYPSDTIGVALAIATHPGTSVASLYNLITTTPPFAPLLVSAPNDWTVSLNFTGLNLRSPSGIAFDSQSNLWVANTTGNFVTEVYSGADGINAIGTSSQYSGGGLLGPQGIAIDLSNNIWIANTAASSVVELDGNGNVLSGVGYTGGGINAPVSIAVDRNGNAWVANFNGNSITQLHSDGTPSGFSPISQGLISGVSFPVSLPTFVAVDSNNSVWVSNSGLNTSYGLNTGMLRFDQNGNPQSCSTQGLAEPLGIAFDHSGTAWVASNGISTVQSLTTACAYNGAPLTGGGLNSTVAVAVDGAGTIWIANASGTISELTPSTGVAESPATGFGTLNAPNGIAIDASGSVWTANTGDNSLTEFIGLAVPSVATPLVASYSKAMHQNFH